MKSRTAAFVLIASALTLSSAAVAQSTNNRPPAGPTGRMTQQQESWRFESEEMRRQNAMTPEEAEAEYGAERVALANRVQALIDEGKCREARALANEAGERQMALRIRQTCRSR
ncbi:hypothetical protein [Brevundimonas sp.]|uniref:hypothetical protein n=1 Tax=Brevundimonas sp. TaxID=1871086 RepID=UPI002EDBA10E